MVVGGLHAPSGRPTDLLVRGLANVKAINTNIDWTYIYTEADASDPPFPTGHY
jgi:hypothetical protein